MKPTGCEDSRAGLDDAIDADDPLIFDDEDFADPRGCGGHMADAFDAFI